MFKSKKGIFALAVAFIIILALGFILLNHEDTAEVVSTIGSNQVHMLNAYAEATKMQEYVKFSMENSAALAAQGLSIGMSPTCFEDIDEINFKRLFEQKMEPFLKAYNSTDKELNVSRLAYSYKYEFSNSSINIRAFAQEPGIVIESSKLDFTYATEGYVETDFTCNEHQAYSGKQLLFV